MTDTICVFVVLAAFMASWGLALICRRLKEGAA
jgi:hypothetical protein